MTIHGLTPGWNVSERRRITPGDYLLRRIITVSHKTEEGGYIAVDHPLRFFNV
jgi:hypothetical protein